VRARHLSARQRLGKALSSGSLCVAYGSLAGTFATIGFGRDQDSRRSTRDFSATLLQTPVGVPVLVALGATVIGVGIYFIVKGITGKFRRELRRFKNNVLIDALGVVGHIAKGVALTLVGILFIVAALKRNPDESTGLDGGLKALALQPYGPLLLVVIGGGLIFYGLFAIVRAKFGRISA
jgi:hypothetical protein